MEEIQELLRKVEKVDIKKLISKIAKSPEIKSELLEKFMGAIT